jgi:DNA-binding NarL/FixJ family response regulator
MTYQRAMQIATAVQEGQRIATVDDPDVVVPKPDPTPAWQRLPDKPISSPNRTSPEKLAQVYELLNQGMPVRRVCAVLGMSEKTVRKYRDKAGIPAVPRGNSLARADFK